MQNIYWPTFNVLVFLQGQRQEPLNISNLKKLITKLSCTQCCNIFYIEFDLHVQIFFSNSWSFLSMNLIFMTKYFSVFLGHFFASNWIFMSRSIWVILGQSLTKHGRSLTWSTWDLFPHVRFSKTFPENWDSKAPSVGTHLAYLQTTA